MAININSVKKYGGLIIASILPIVIYNLFIVSGWGLIWAVIGAIFSMILGVMLFNVIYRHPLIDLIEGKGILILTLDSTGIIHPYIAQVEPPMIKAKGKGGMIHGIFDRKGLAYLKVPTKAKLNIDENNNDKILTLKLPKNSEHKYTFGFGSFPVFLYNRNLQEFISKDSLANLEMDASIRSMVFYLKKKTEELTSVMRDFARYVIEMSKPRPAFAFMKSIWFWVMILVVLGLLAYLFLPQLLNGASMPIANTIPKPSNVVTP